MWLKCINNNQHVSIVQILRSLQPLLDALLNHRLKLYNGAQACCKVLSDVSPLELCLQRLADSQNSAIAMENLSAFQHKLSDTKASVQNFIFFLQFVTKQ